MHVRRIVISRYGPLKPLDETLAAFTVIRGPNERGKTLIIDALVRMLFKDALKRPQQKLFGNLTRVDESPEGFLVLATHAGEVKIGAAESISDATPVAITPEDFRNVFLIRDSDLALHDEESYYGRVSERLCGTRSTTIERLKDALKKIGRLRSATPDSVLTVRKDRDHKRIGEQLIVAEKLLDDLIQTGSALARDDFDTSYRRLAEFSETRERLGEEFRARRDAARRAQFERARVAAREVRDAMAALAALGSADDRLLESWRAMLVRRETFERDLTDVTARGVELRAARDGARQEWEAARARARAQDARRERAETELRPALDDWTRARAERDHAERSGRAVVAVLSGVAVCGVGAVVVALVTRWPWMIGAAFMCAVAAGVCGWWMWRGARARLALARREADIVATAARLGLAVGSVREIGEALRSLEHDAAQAQERARDAEVLMKQRDSDVAACERNATDKRTQIADNERALAAIRVETGCESVELLAAAVEKRRALENDIMTRFTMLRGWIPQAAAVTGQDAFLSACEREIERGLDTLPASDLPEDPEATARVERELERMAAEEKQIRQKLERTRQALRHLEIRVTDLGVLEAPVHCRTTRELADVQRRVAEFCETIQRDARLAKEAIRILQDIEAEENEKVGELFGNDTLVSRWFHDITGGRYRAVHLKDGDVVVEFADGRRLSASALSGGTFDQLYLAIRASIAERMLPEAKGFFILDDPFLKADRDRMRTLMKMLRQLVARGWQVIYVTAKDEVVDALAADIAAGAVRLLELEAPLFARGPVRAPTATDAPRLL
jgi:hypothetical protein